MSTVIPQDARSLVDGYLDAVEKIMETTGIERERRRAIVDDLETQILDMLRLDARENATKESVQSVLDRLDPPEAYAKVAGSNFTPSIPVPPPSNTPRRFSPQARAGAIWIGFGLTMLLVLSRVFSTPTGVVMPEHLSTGATLILATLAGAFIIASIAGTVLGWLAAVRITASKGIIYGMGWAAIEAMLCPVLCVWGLSCFLSYLVVVAYYNGSELPDRGRAVFFIAWACLGAISSAALGWLLISVLARTKRRVEKAGDIDKASIGIAS